MRQVQAVISFPVEVTILVNDNEDYASFSPKLIEEAIRCRNQGGEPVIDFETVRVSFYTV